MRTISLLVLILCLIISQGCATIIHGKKQEITIDSTPRGADAVINNKMKVKTPSTVTLERKYTYRIEVSKPGYQPQTTHLDKNFSAWYLLNIPFIGAAGAGLVGLILDAVNGSMWNLDPGQTSFILEPNGQPQAGPGSTKRAATGRYHPPDVRIPEYGGERHYAAVMDLERKVGMSNDLASLLSEKFRIAVCDTGLFRVVDRNNMETILKEQGFQLSDCTSSECAVEVGRLMGVTKMILGSIGKIEEKSIITIQMVNVETGEIEAVAGEECYCQMAELTQAVETAVRRLAVKIVEGSR